MSEYYKRQIELWGEETQKSLANKSIAIIGCGGLGCSLGIALGSSGIGEIHLVDFDEVSVHNIHRQIAFELDDEGKNKSEALANRLLKRSAFVKVTPHVCDFNAFCKKDIKVDLIIDATDNLKTRSAIAAFAKERKMPWLHGAVEEWRGQVCLFDKADFSACFTITDKKPKGVTPPPVMMIGAFEATIALRYLAGLNVQKDVLHMLYFTDDGVFEKRSFEF